ncbi:MAG TPA: nucleotidyltransferase domain-containing protein [Thermotogota bacterium]|nr:nucleotidyltransferase domain-containing protein [Thermotogota bacterium]
MQDNIIKEINEIAADYKDIKVILFGSRARKENKETSDYDIAFFSDKLSDIDKAILFDKIQAIETLKKIDLVFIDHHTDRVLLENINRDGVIINDKRE